jgi:2-furoyl-CoA dehydrogenase FAD binding subunit
VKPPRFDYVRPETVDEALEVLATEAGNARVLAGGQSLVPMLGMRLARPSLLIDINRIAGLKDIRQEKYAILVPAAARQAALLAFPGLREACPLLARAMPWIGHAQTRSRGTVCGSIAHADPSAELVLCLVALGGSVNLRSRRRRRSVAAREFFAGLMTTSREEDELVESVTFPVARGGAGYAFAEFARRHGDFAIVSVAAVARPDAIEVTVGGVDDVPAHRSWARLPGDDLDDALNTLAWELDARDDIHADARLRRDLVRSIGRRTVEEAAACIA